MEFLKGLGYIMLAIVILGILLGAITVLATAGAMLGGFLTIVIIGVFLILAIKEAFFGD